MHTHTQTHIYICMHALRYIQHTCTCMCTCTIQSTLLFPFMIHPSTITDCCQTQIWPILSSMHVHHLWPMCFFFLFFFFKVEKLLTSTSTYRSHWKHPWMQLMPVLNKTFLCRTIGKHIWHKCNQLHRMKTNKGEYIKTGKRETKDKNKTTPPPQKKKEVSQRGGGNQNGTWTLQYVACIWLSASSVCMQRICTNTYKMSQAFRKMSMEVLCCSLEES